MRTVGLIVALLALLTSVPTAQTSVPLPATSVPAAATSDPTTTGARATSVPTGATSVPAWHFDGGLFVGPEAWDLNGSREWLGGAVVGVNRQLWRGLAGRVEALALRVVEQPQSAWLAGFTLGTRMRWQSHGVRPLLDVAVGLSESTTAVPAQGTTFNYLAVIGGGVELARGARSVVVTGRWLHASNNGRAGRARNPDIQALGVTLGVGWRHP